MDNNGRNEINNITSPNFMFELDEMNNYEDDIWDFEFPTQLENNLQFPSAFPSMFNHQSISQPQTHMDTVPYVTTDHQLQTTHNFSDNFVVVDQTSKALQQPLQNLPSVKAVPDDVTFGVSDEMKEENAIEISDDDVTDPKKKKLKKNLLMEKKRRQMLNERLKRLRSVVPIITKMDRMSTLGDAVEYLKDLCVKIDKVRSELEAPVVAPTTVTTGPSSIGAQVSQKPIRIDVKRSEGGIVVIHMCSSWRPGLAKSITKALIELGLELEHAVISCLDGFMLDVYQAKQSRDVHEDQIRAVLLETARHHGVV